MSSERITIFIGAGQLLFAALAFFGVNATGLRKVVPPMTAQPVVVITLIAGGLAFSVWGFYRTLNCRQFDQFAKLEQVDHQAFRNQEVEMDGKDFIGCKFENVTFVYRGIAPVAMRDNNIYGTYRLSIDDPASFHLMVMAKGLGFLRPEVPVTGGKNFEPLPNVESPKHVP